MGQRCGKTASRMKNLKDEDFSKTVSFVEQVGTRP